MRKLLLRSGVEFEQAVGARTGEPHTVSGGLRWPALRVNRRNGSGRRQRDAFAYAAGAIPKLRTNARVM